MCGRDEKCIHNFSRKPEGKRSLGRSKCRWEDNIKLDLEMGYEDVEWIHRDQWRALVNTVMNLWVP